MGTTYKTNTASELGFYAGSTLVNKLGSEEAANIEKVYYRELDRVTVTLEKSIEGLVVARKYERIEYKGLRQHVINEFLQANEAEAMTPELWEKAFGKYSGFGETFTKDENDVFGIRKGKQIIELNTTEMDALNITNPFRYANLYM